MSEPQKYRKKPVEIEAMRWDGSFDSYLAVPKWAQSHGALNVNIREFEEGECDVDHIRVHTLEGVMRASAGDYVIRGIRGEFYPCKPDIFEATYEECGGDER